MRTRTCNVCQSIQSISPPSVRVSSGLSSYTTRKKDGTIARLLACTHPRHLETDVSIAFEPARKSIPIVPETAPLPNQQKRSKATHTHTLSLAYFASDTQETLAVHIEDDLKKNKQKNSLLVCVLFVSVWFCLGSSWMRGLRTILDERLAIASQRKPSQLRFKRHTVARSL